MFAEDIDTSRVSFIDSPCKANVWASECTYSVVGLPKDIHFLFNKCRCDSNDVACTLQWIM